MKGCVCLNDVALVDYSDHDNPLSLPDFFHFMEEFKKNLANLKGTATAESDRAALAAFEADSNEILYDIASEYHYRTKGNIGARKPGWLKKHDCDAIRKLVVASSSANRQSLPPNVPVRKSTRNRNQSTQQRQQTSPGRPNSEVSTMAEPSSAPIQPVPKKATKKRTTAKVISAKATGAKATGAKIVASSPPLQSGQIGLSRSNVSPDRSVTGLRTPSPHRGSQGRSSPHIVYDMDSSPLESTSSKAMRVAAGGSASKVVVEHPRTPIRPLRKGKRQGGTYGTGKTPEKEWHKNKTCIHADDPEFHPDRVSVTEICDYDAKRHCLRFDVKLSEKPGMRYFIEHFDMWKYKGAVEALHAFFETWDARKQTANNAMRPFIQEVYRVYLEGEK